MIELEDEFHGVVPYTAAKTNNISNTDIREREKSFNKQFFNHSGEEVSSTDFNKTFLKTSVILEFCAAC